MGSLVLWSCDAYRIICKFPTNGQKEDGELLERMPPKKFCSVALHSFFYLDFLKSKPILKDLL